MMPPRSTRDAVQRLVRSAMAIAVGVLVTAALLQVTADPIRSSFLHIVAGPSTVHVTGGDWLYIAGVSIVRYAPFAIGALAAGFLAPPDRTIRALAALDIALVLWLLNVF